MVKIVFLPLDERPCNYNFPYFILEGNADFRIVRPPLSILGKKKIPADGGAVCDFLKRECRDAEYLILSADMLLYGGIVPSRLHRSGERELTEKLEILSYVKQVNPKLKIYAFSLIMRCPSYSSADEEPDYYGWCGREIFLRGQFEHKFKKGVITKEEYTEGIRPLDEKIGNNIADYLERRKTNLSLVLKTLSLVGGVIDKFIIPQDDSAPIGTTALDREAVTRYIAENGIKGVDIYPGADEAGMTMLSAAITGAKNKSPKIYPLYPKAECKDVVPLYEDRRVDESISFQIKNAGCIRADSAEEADIILFCNLPAGKMKNAGEGGGEGYAERDLPSFTEKMRNYISEGKMVAAADLAYCNGGDTEWVKLIEKTVGISSLAGYAGWNTSSNSLGTVICQSAVYYFYGNTPAHGRFTAERIFEDVGYCAYVRKYMCDNVLPSLGLGYFDAGATDGEVANTVKEKITERIAETLPSVCEKYEISSCIMPWRRMFEVGLTVRERISANG